MINLNDLVLFASAVECGGFAAASRQLGLPKSTISKRVAALEDSLSARLIHRTSRAFALTDVGRDFYEHARAVMIEGEAAEAVVLRRRAEPSGTVRISASVPVAQLYLAAHLPRLARAYPKLRIELDVTDRFVDVLQEGVDIAVRSHFAPLPDSGLVQRKMAVEPIILVAAPAYVEVHGEPQSPVELEDHSCLLTSPSARLWRLFGAGGRLAEVVPGRAMVANESVVLMAAATAALGIACLPERMCRDALATSQLLQVLPEWNAGTVTTTLLMPHRRGELPSVRATVEFLAECFEKLT